MKLPFNLQGTLVTILVNYGKDFFLAVAPEAIPLVEEFFMQRASPDGWTRKERLLYTLGVIRRIKAKKIGNVATDRVGDWVLDAWEDLVQDSIDELDGGVVVPPPVEDPAAPGQIGVMYETKPTRAGYFISVRLWANQPPTPEAKRWVVLPTSAPGWVGWVEEMWD